jgi:hypothetical protein
VNQFILLWAQAIAAFEGFNTPGSRPARNNNPGDLKYAGQPGATGQDAQGFAVFPDVPTGWQALYNQLNAYVQEFPGYSLYQIMEHYLGQSITASGGETTSQGNSTTYAQSVASAIGVDPSTTLAQLVAASTAVLPLPTDSDDQDDSGSQIVGLSQNGILLMIAGGALFFYLLTQFLWSD